MTTLISTTPSITINTPDSFQTTQPTTTTMSPPTPPKLSTTTTQLFNPPSSSEPQTCYLCTAELPSDFSPTTKFLDTCLLCTRTFCPLHRGQWDSVCNINHSTYYHEHPELHDAKDVEKSIFPSLGEREKMIFTSPTEGNNGDKMLQSIAAELALSQKEKENLIEEKELVGADIAV